MEEEAWLEKKATEDQKNRGFLCWEELLIEIKESQNSSQHKWKWKRNSKWEEPHLFTSTVEETLTQANLGRP